jgi:glycosyltransferase involved in cell wall biosynthesis
VRVALIRGPDLNPWELAIFEGMPVELRLFGSLRGNFGEQRLPWPVTRLASPHDALNRLPGLVQPLALRLTGSPSWLAGLEHALAGFDVAHVVELHNPYSLQAVRARDDGRCRAVVATVFENVPARPTENPIVERRVHEVARGVDRFIAVTQGARAHLELAGVEAARISVIPMGVDVQRFAPPDERPTGGPLRILSVARLVFEKGVEDLVVAVAMLQRRGVDARLTLVGRGRLERRLPRLAAQLGVGDRVELRGSVGYDEVPGLYKRSDVFVMASTPLPTWREQFGFAPVEAMASGLPVLLGDSGSLPEVVGDPEALVRPHDPSALAARLAELAADPQLRRRRGEINRQRALEHYDRRSVRDAIFAVYEEALGP